MKATCFIANNEKLLRYLCCFYEWDIHHLTFSINYFVFSTWGLLSINRSCHLVTAAAAGLETEPENPERTSAKVGSVILHRSNCRCLRWHRRISETYFCPSLIAANNLTELLFPAIINIGSYPFLRNYISCLLDGCLGCSKLLKAPNKRSCRNEDNALRPCGALFRALPAPGPWEEVGGRGVTGGSRVSLKSFHVVPEIFGDSRRLRSESSPKCEVSGWDRGGSGLEPKP